MAHEPPEGHQDPAGEYEDQSRNRPLNQPPPERPLEAPAEGWMRVWLPVTLLLVLAMFVGMRAIMRTGEPWAECQLRYVEATTSRDSAMIDRMMPTADPATTCGAIRIQRS